MFTATVIFVTYLWIVALCLNCALTHSLLSENNGVVIGKRLTSRGNDKIQNKNSHRVARQADKGWTVKNYPNPQQEYKACNRTGPSLLCDPDRLLRQGSKLERLLVQTCEETTCPCPRCSGLCEGYTIVVAVMRQIQLKGASLKTWANELRNEWTNFGNCDDVIVILATRNSGTTHSTDFLITTSVGRKGSDVLTEECIESIQEEYKGALETVLYSTLTEYRDTLKDGICTITKDGSLGVPTLVIIINLSILFVLGLLCAIWCCIWCIRHNYHAAKIFSKLTGKRVMTPPSKDKDGSGMPSEPTFTIASLQPPKDMFKGGTEAMRAEVSVKFSSRASDTYATLPNETTDSDNNGTSRGQSNVTWRSPDDVRDARGHRSRSRERNLVRIDGAAKSPTRRNSYPRQQRNQSPDKSSRRTHSTHRSPQRNQSPRRSPQRNQSPRRSPQRNRSPHISPQRNRSSHRPSHRNY